MTEESIKDKIARQDHDSIIRIETVVNNMAVDLKVLADGLATRVTAVETRTTALEKVNDEVKPPSLLMTVTEHDRQIREFKTTIKNLNWIIGGSFLGLIAVIGYFTKIFGLAE